MTSSNFSFQQELAITEKIPHLSILLKKYYSEKRYILLITLAPVINLSSEYVHELLKKSCADEKIDAYDPDIFSNLIFEKAKNDLAFNDFSFSDLNELAEVERKMMLEFLKARLQGIIDNALNFSKIIESIFKYYPILKSKRLQLVTENKWGDFDESKWDKLIFEFYSDKIAQHVSDWSSIITSPMIRETNVGSFILSRQSPINGTLVLIKSIIENVNILESLKPFFELQELPVSEIKVETGRDFEESLLLLIKKEIPDLDVSLTSESGDQGADLIIFSSKGKMVIQAKYYTGSVGNTAVQEVFAAKQFYKSTYAMVVCNSYYTKSAISLAEKTNVYLKTKSDFIYTLKDLLT